MAFVPRDKHVTGPIVEGRPDFADHGFGITLAKKHPPFVFSTRPNSALVHRVLRVELRWYAVVHGGRDLCRVNVPRATAHCACGQFFHLYADRTRTCLVPKPDAVMCERCQGNGSTFSKQGQSRKGGKNRKEAGPALGCVVAGY